MTIVFQGLLLNTCIAAALAAILFLVQRVRPLRHRPQLCHALWLLLLLKLFMPPLVVMNLPWPQWVKATPSFQISNEPFPQGMNPVAMDPVAMDVVQMDLAKIDPVELDPVDHSFATSNVATISDASNVASGSLLQIALVTIWFVGCVSLLLGGYVQHRRLSRLIRSTSSGPEWLQDSANSAAREFKLERVPDVRVVDAVVTPFLWAGAGGPLIVIPLRLLDALKPEDIRLVMKHELAHYVRRDHWSGATVSLACLLLWWNPLVWWIRRETRSLQEACCDQLVLESNGEDRHRYAEVLMATIDMVVGCKTPDYRPATAFGDGRTLKRRIEMIVNNSIPAMRWQVLSAAVLIASALLLPLGIAFAQDDPVNASGQKALPFNTLPQDASDDEQQEGSSADHSSTVQGPSGLYESPRGRSVSRPPGTLTVQQAAEMVKKANETRQPELDLNWLTSIDQDVAGELSHYGGQRLLLDGLTSITQEVAHELTKVQPGRFGWYNRLSLRPDIPAKSLSLDGLTSITKEVAHELAKCNGSLNLNYVKSMDSEVARELAKFQGDFLNIQNLESIAPEDMNILKDGLRGRGGSEKFYRAMMPYKLNDGTMVKKWNGRIIEYRKDGSKMRETDYKYGGVTLRMEWDEAGNLTKEETFPVHKPRGVEVDEPGEIIDLGKENPDSDLTFDNVRFAPERKYPYDDLAFREKANKELIAYAKGEEEPFTGVGVSPNRKGSLGWETRFLNGKLHGKKILFNNDGSIAIEETYLNGKLHGQSIGWYGPDRPNWEKQHINGKQISDKVYFRSGSVRTETSFKGGKPVLKSTWDKDGNLIESETF